MQTRNDDVVTNYTPISRILQHFDHTKDDPELPLLLTDERRRRPDIVNLTQLHIYEIKPATTIDAGLAQAQMYLGLLEKGGVTMSLGPRFAPGTHGQLPAPDGVFIFYSPRPGVIAYQSGDPAAAKF